MMSINTPVVATFESQCRALAVTASPDENASRFLVGTLCPSSDNFLYLFEYREDSSSLAKIAFKYPYGEIWHISSFLKQPDIVSITSAHHGKYRISLFKLPPGIGEPIEDDYGLSEAPIEKVQEIISDETCLVPQSHWHPDNGDKLLTFNDKSLNIWNIEDRSNILGFDICKAIQKYGLENTNLDRKCCKVTDLKWSALFNSSVMALTYDNHIFGFDTRIPDTDSSSICWLIKDQRCNRIRSIDFNPNSQFYIASGGDDCRANIWDLRKTSEPTLYFQSHTHWVWTIRYNPFHDQLILSGGGDGRASLIKAQSVSSDDSELCVQEGADDRNGSVGPGDDNSNSQDSNNGEEDEILKQPPRDELIETFDEHDDSVYAAEWATDPWIFATLGFESRLIIHKVPKEEKFNILFR